VNAWIGSLVSVALVSLVSLAGVATLSMNERLLRRLALVLVSFAVGGLLGDSFIHLIPEALESGATVATSLWILGGMLLFFVIEKLLRHHHGPLYSEFHPGETARPELAAINVIGDAVHNFVDGAIIAASWLAGPMQGIATTIAVVLHEVPQELGDFGILVHSGMSVRRAIVMNLASASTAFAGGILVLLAGEAWGESLESILIPLGAGGFVYIAAADLIPELQHDRSLRGLLVQAGLISLGIGAMAALVPLEPLLDGMVGGE
jgi:zinc and cadmium transporter